MKTAAIRRFQVARRPSNTPPFIGQYTPFSPSMPAMTPFCPRTLPLDHSRPRLIEASAGTGKTYGIAALFTRMILEGRDIAAILVLTFTEAAAAELKNRLRARLGEAAARLAASDTAAEADETLNGLLEDAQTAYGRDIAAARIQAALNAFDTAAIYTIHGFCMRVLGDEAFLCGVPFELTLENDRDTAGLNAAEEFWRKRVATCPDQAALAVQNRLDPQNAAAEMRPFVKKPFLYWNLPADDNETVQAACAAAWESVRNLGAEYFQVAFERIRPALNGNSYRQATFAQLFEELTAAIEQGLRPDSFSKPEKLCDLAADTLAAKCKKGQSVKPDEAEKLAPLAEFGRLYRHAAEAEKNAVCRLKLELLDHLNRAAETAKQQSDKRDYDDLLLDVYHALHHSPHAQALADRLAQKWSAVLIDEFQDTDPLQYAVFKTAFIGRHIPVFLVGDPKQAIYGFRGADIHAYLDAAAGIADEDRYTLAVNYRSSSGVIGSIGTLFGRRENPFVLTGIPYVQVASKRGTGSLTPAAAAFRLRWLNREEDGKTADKETLRARAADYCARETAQRLNDAAAGVLKLDGRRIEPKDIAVLVRTHNEAELIRRHLAKRGIRSVLLQQQSVFHTPEAAAFRAMLLFWLNPPQSSLLRFLLCGCLYRRTAGDIQSLNADEHRLAAWAELAAAALENWQTHGLYAAAAVFARDSGLETDLLQLGQERSLTNFWQLAELAAAEAERHTSPESLLNWFDAQIRDGSINEERQLRLESDENLVKIVTMHAAKGLEYPIVFCPFAWDAAAPPAGGWLTARRPDGRRQLLAAESADETDKQQLFADRLGESLRLLYVALTRAREELIVYAAASGALPDSPFAYLLGNGGDCHSVREYWKQRRNCADEWKHIWQDTVDAMPDGRFDEDEPPQTHYTPCQTDGQNYRALNHPPRRWPYIRHTSFTALSRNRQQNPAEERSEQTESDGAGTASAFPKGTAAGLCLHSILEEGDFGRPAAEQQETVAAVLGRYGYGETQMEAACAMLDAVRSTPLLSGSLLGGIPPRQRLSEMDFVFRIEAFSPEKIRNWFQKQAAAGKLPPEAISDLYLLDFQTVNGFLNGAIDLLAQDGGGHTFLIDFKSNYLGPTSADYHQAAMSAAVSRHHYTLQALIYAVAAARYLKQRRQLPDVLYIRYLFLRGLDGSGNGIWQWNLATADLAEWL